MIRDDTMPNQVTTKVLNIKDEIQHFTKNMRDKVTSLEDIINSLNTDFSSHINTNATADDDTYGHVKMSGSIIENSDDTEITIPNISAIINYVNSKEESIKTYYGKNEEDNGTNSSDIHDTIDQKINDKVSKYNIESKLKRFSSVIPYQIPNDYLITEKKIDDTIEDISANELKPAKLAEGQGVKTYITPGHYHISPKTGEENTFTIQYGTISKNYAGGLLDIRRISNIVIQELYTTTNEYKLSGEKYIRKGTINDNTVTWEPWSLAYMPYSESDIGIDILGTGINNIVLKENTGGYIIEWTQAESSYALEENAGQSKKIVEFNNEININTPYKFSSYLGGFEIEITKSGIYITSNKQKGTNINYKYLQQTYFVPRVR